MPLVKKLQLEKLPEKLLRSNRKSKRKLKSRPLLKPRRRRRKERGGEHVVSGECNETEIRAPCGEENFG